MFNYEKFINKNFPISHILGNNFWTYSFNYGTKIKDFHLFFVINFLEKGEDALYSDFNTDYLNYSIDQGYEEDFPFINLIVISLFQWSLCIIIKIYYIFQIC